MSKAKRKSTPKPAPEPDDAELIQQCVRYAQAIAGAAAGFDADPDGNKEHAGHAASVQYRRAREALAYVGKTPANTASGICAKARIVTVMLNGEGGLEDMSAPFLLCFAADVKQYMDHVIEQEWEARHGKPLLLPMEAPK
jgi:hypothetical protein